MNQYYWNIWQIFTIKRFGREILIYFGKVTYRGNMDFFYEEMLALKILFYKMTNLAEVIIKVDKVDKFKHQNNTNLKLAEPVWRLSGFKLARQRFLLQNVENKAKMRSWDSTTHLFVSLHSNYDVVVATYEYSIKITKIGEVGKEMWSLK